MQTHIIEVLDMGVWQIYDETDNLEDAILLASALCQTLPEDEIRITPQNPLNFPLHSSHNKLA